MIINKINGHLSVCTISPPPLMFVRLLVQTPFNVFSVIPGMICFGGLLIWEIAVNSEHLDSKLVQFVKIVKSLVWFPLFHKYLHVSLYCTQKSDCIWLRYINNI